MDIKIGNKLNIRGVEAKVIGFIEYANIMDQGKRWREYRLTTSSGECWLSVDEVYNEYSLSFPANNVRGNVGPEWHKVDEGRQKVTACGGYVDVDFGEQADFVEFEDANEERILSVEIWSDGTEYSTGYYVEAKDIVVTGYEAPQSLSARGLPAIVRFLVIMIFMTVAFSIMATMLRNSKAPIAEYLKQNASYEYVTSITGNQEQKADVYAYSSALTTDDVAKDIINGIEGNTESVTQKDDTADEEIAILTQKEYCLVYHPEDDPATVYIQVSSRKYNYTSDNEPYRSSKSNAGWYRSHYYSSGYNADASSYSGTPSAYTSYQGDTIHNIGNGYFDSYSSSVRQSSINSRSSSSGGGK